MIVKGCGLPIGPAGACANLTTDNLCGVYEDRPKICRVGIRDWELQAAGCNWLQRRQGIGKEFRVVLPGQPLVRKLKLAALMAEHGEAIMAELPAVVG